ncbi:MAG: DHH family phosphoesterase [Candidatus Pacearchaeota archaeon]
MLLDELKKAVDRFRKLDGTVRIITHFDTDGITAGAILSIALKRMDRQFKITSINQLERKNFEMLKNEENPLLFLIDVGSSHLHELSKFKGNIFILDHHEIENIDVPENISFINPHKTGEEESSASALAYLFVKELDNRNTDLANLAILGMIGDFADQNLGKIGNSIIQDAKDLIIKKGLLLFPSTRPLNKALEFSNIYIPGVTGSSIGALNLIRESGIKIKEGTKYKTILDLTEEEFSRLLTLITLKRRDTNRIIGNIYLIKFFNQLEDARELSTLINACGRLGHADIALALCMGSKKAKSAADAIYSSYKYQLISGLNWISTNDKIEGDGYIIINAGSQIKDSIIGTLISILASSFIYPEGTILIGMAMTEDKRIKVSARIVGCKENLNLKKLLETPTKLVGGESGGHKNAAGCFIPLNKEKTFLELLQKELRVLQLQIKI